MNLFNKKNKNNKANRNDEDTDISKKYKSDRLAEILSLPQGTFKNFPSIQIRGNREIIIDGCTGLLSYEQEKILLETKYCRICISGRALTLNNLTKNIIAIRGFIKNVEFNM
ncbi:MAG: YabP/YqfC family sporulation protein [Oscillospiraceae bacterium]|nr:YabP/YqfC family sporulation protein [Oscillospiraceae bacterium]